jgi:hypothetical protein
MAVAFSVVMFLVIVPAANAALTDRWDTNLQLHRLLRVHVPACCART